MEIAVYGGSFNPPHVGHAMVAAWLHWTGLAEQVWLVPAFSHAFDKPLAPFALRMEACRRMASSLGDWANVEGIEAELPGPSYTIRTLDSLSARHPGLRLRWVVGSDALPTRHLWREWDRIVRDYPPIVVGRAGYAVVEGAPTFPDVSSTEVRQRLAEGRSVQHLLETGVRTLVEENAALFFGD